MTHSNISNIVILASGSGTNAENIIRYFENHERIRVRLVVSNKEDAFVLKRAAKLNVPSVVIPAKKWQHSQYVLDIFNEYEIHYMVLAGYLRLIPSWLVKQYAGKIINIHPALLPKYGGKGMFGEHVHTAVIASGEKTTGITIHHVNEHYDQGDVIFQIKCPVLPDDTPDSLAFRIHALEYEHFPVIIENEIIRIRTL